MHHTKFQEFPAIPRERVTTLECPPQRIKVSLYNIFNRMDSAKLLIYKCIYATRTIQHEKKKGEIAMLSRRVAVEY
jgi:hypothetical protein